MRLQLILTSILINLPMATNAEPWQGHNVADFIQSQPAVYANKIDQLSFALIAEAFGTPEELNAMLDSLAAEVGEENLGTQLAFYLIAPTTKVDVTVLDSFNPRTAEGSYVGFLQESGICGYLLVTDTTETIKKLLTQKNCSLAPVQMGSSKGAKLPGQLSGMASQPKDLLAAIVQTAMGVPLIQPISPREWQVITPTITEVGKQEGQLVQIQYKVEKIDITQNAVMNIGITKEFSHPDGITWARDENGNLMMNLAVGFDETFEYQQ